MLLTGWCIAVVLLGTLALGVPLRWLLGGCRPLSAPAWVEAPFLGLGVVVLVLQNLVYCHVPVKFSAPLIWGLIALTWVVLFAARQVRACGRDCPRTVLAACLIVYLVQGLGLVVIGARHYVGRGWIDQYNYTVTAQLLMDVDQDTPMAAVGNRPYLVRGMVQKNDRIGQSLLQGFFAVSCGCGAKPLFEPTSLLSPTLIVLAVYALGRRFALPHGAALLAGAAAGLLPGVTMVHLESFFSQALAMPLLLFCPVLLEDVAAERSPWAVLRAGIVLAATASFYAEFFILVASLALLFLVLTFSAGTPPLVGAGGIPGAGGVAPPAQPALRRAPLRRPEPVAGSDTRPHLSLGPGGGRRGPSLAGRPGRVGPVLIRPFTLGLTALACYGLAQACASALLGPPPGDERQGQPSPAFSLSVLGLLALPFVVIAKDDQHPYQFYKLLLTVSPLLLLGLALLGQSVARRILAIGDGGRSRIGRRLLAALPLGLLGLLALAVGAGTVYLVRTSMGGDRSPRCLGARLLLFPDVRGLEEYLETLHGHDIVYYGTDHFTDTGYYLNSWIAYFARHNRLWACNPHFTDSFDLDTIPEAAAITNLGSLPGDCLFLTKKRTLFLQPPESPGHYRTVWENGSYILWAPTMPDWAVITRVTCRHGLDRSSPRLLCSGGGDTTLEVLTPRTGTLRLKVSADPAPFGSLDISTDTGFSEGRLPAGGWQEWQLPVRRGFTRIRLRLGSRMEGLPAVELAGLSLEPEPRPSSGPESQLKPILTPAPAALPK